VTAALCHIPTLTTGRLTLRAPERGDFDAYADMLADPRTAFMGGPFNRSAAWAEFCKAIASWHLSGFGGWLMIDSTGDTLLGEVGITQSQRFPEPELGWTVTAKGEGKGHAYEAARAALDWFWVNTNAQSLVSYITPANTRSAALATRLGATPDPSAPLPTGETHDEMVVYRHSRGSR
jgi:RimJ/RimL family protein N-acetyltransferase